MLFPGVLKRLRDWRERRRALQEYAGQSWDDREWVRLSAEAELKVANWAAAAGEWETAFQICERIHQMQTETIGVYILQVRALREMQRPEEADALVEVARRRYPADMRVGEMWAQSAERRGDLTAAIGMWKRLQKMYPTDARVIDGSALCLIAAGRLDEADALLSEAVQRLPDSMGLASKWAELGVRRRDWAQALQRWHSVIERFPRTLPARLGAARSLCELQRDAEAEELLKGAQTDFPGTPGPYVEFAQLAQRRRDWPEAERRWNLARGVFPSNIPAFVGLAAALREQQRFDEAEVLLEEATQKIPDDPRLFIERAALAHHRRDWAEAARRWEVVRTRFPDRAIGFRRGAAALAALGRQAEAQELESDAKRRFPAKTG